MSTRLTYNCEDCKKYWAEHIKIWEGLGVPLSYIKVYCPTCTRPEMKR